MPINLAFYLNLMKKVKGSNQREEEQGVSQPNSSLVKGNDGADPKGRQT